MTGQTARENPDKYGLEEKERILKCTISGQLFGL